MGTIVDTSKPDDDNALQHVHKHLYSQSHIDNQAKIPKGIVWNRYWSLYFCTLCKSKIGHYPDVLIHIKGRKHFKKMSEKDLLRLDVDHTNLFWEHLNQFNRSRNDRLPDGVTWNPSK